MQRQRVQRLPWTKRESDQSENDKFSFDRLQFFRKIYRPILLTSLNRIYHVSSQLSQTWLNAMS